MVDASADKTNAERKIIPARTRHIATSTTRYYRPRSADVELRLFLRIATSASRPAGAKNTVDGSGTEALEARVLDWKKVALDPGLRSRINLVSSVLTGTGNI